MHGAPQPGLFPLRLASHALRYLLVKSRAMQGSSLAQAGRARPCEGRCFGRPARSWSGELPVKTHVLGIGPGSQLERALRRSGSGSWGAGGEARHAGAGPRSPGPRASSLSQRLPRGREPAGARRSLQTRAPPGPDLPPAARLPGGPSPHTPKALLWSGAECEPSSLWTAGWWDGKRGAGTLLLLPGHSVPCGVQTEGAWWVRGRGRPLPPSLSGLRVAANRCGGVLPSSGV